MAAAVDALDVAGLASREHGVHFYPGWWKSSAFEAAAGKTVSIRGRCVGIKDDPQNNPPHIVILEDCEVIGETPPANLPVKPTKSPVQPQDGLLPPQVPKGWDPKMR
jgi:hypothetical protein